MDTPLWHCSVCGRAFANRNQSHACGRHDLAHHFSGRPPVIRELFDRFVAALEQVGPHVVLPEKTRIAFQVRMSLVQLTPRQRWLDGHVVLARRVAHAQVRDVRTFSPRNHVHTFRISSTEDIDGLLPLLREAYAVGEQRHLESRT